MKKFIKTKTFWLTGAAVVLSLGMTVQGAMAYFTTYVTARGGYPINFETTTSIEEQFENMTKHITISNTGDSDCYVRVRVFSGSQFEINYSGAVDNDGSQYWTLNEDGYWYYRDIVVAGESTQELLAQITLPEDQKESFNVVVVQECTPVLYDEGGNPYADWNRIADTRTDIGTAVGEGA